MTDQATTPAAGGAVNPPGAAINPAPDAPQATEGQTAETGGEKAGTEGEGKKVSRFSMRISQLVAQRRESDARAEANLRRAEAAEARLRENAGKSKEDLDYDAREALRLETILDRREARDAQNEAQEHANASLGAMANAVAIKLEEAGDPALDPILNDPNFPMTDDVTAFLADTDQAVPIAKHLSQNPQLAARLAHMTFRGNRQQRGTATRASMREADRILLGLEARFKAGVTVQPRTATRAPAPGTTLAGGAPPAASTLEELASKGEDATDYLAARKAQWAKERAR